MPGPNRRKPAPGSTQGMIRFTGLWRGKTSTGETFLEGAVTPSMHLYILPAPEALKRRNPGAPDYVAFLEPTSEAPEAKQRPLIPDDL